MSTKTDGTLVNKELADHTEPRTETGTPVLSLRREKIKSLRARTGVRTGQPKHQQCAEEISAF